MTRTRSTALAVLLALVTAVPVAPVAAQSAASQNARNGRDRASGLSVPVVGTVATTGGTVAGTLLIKEFVRNGDGIDAIGTLTATITNAGVSRMVVSQVAWPVNMANTGGQAAAPSDFAIQQAVCEILHLELGPLNLDLLGLVVDLNQVVLDITAVAGAGNLLGNLLCAVVGLLDGGGALTQITNLLNQILGILG
jgi:hypothetical protein